MPLTVPSTPSEIAQGLAELAERERLMAEWLAKMAHRARDTAAIEKPTAPTAKKAKKPAWWTN